jgi:hypothetical protein
LAVSDFMRVFEAKALATALTEAGHSVSERTVQRWKAGDTPSKAQDVRAIRELVGAMIADTTNEAAPLWAGRLVANVEAIAQKVGVTDDDRLEAERLAVAEMPGEAPLSRSDDGARAG